VFSVLLLHIERDASSRGQESTEKVRKLVILLIVFLCLSEVKLCFLGFVLRRILDHINLSSLTLTLPLTGLQKCASDFASPS